MARVTWPRKVKTGPLAGKQFDSFGDYKDALQATKKSPPARVTKKMAESLVAGANMILAVVPQTRQDVLDEIEQKALTNAILDTAKSNQFFANIVVKVCSAGSVASLGTTVGAIIAVRMAKRERIPPIIGDYATLALYAMAQEDVSEIPDDGPPADNEVIEFNPNGEVPVVATG